ncbi:unnamed protein product [Gemmata massiliana]|uniref:Uncharacterized protein n=1 Tax=Gemmata massiliana TaxID=1210884 RepID=A0A6P2DIP5_9BACT|nr:GNAT family N-acetyltransferase [Gemmata massiliana]VTS01314.1 unnamed protein product [Gemmata massiliana]
MSTPLTLPPTGPYYFAAPFVVNNADKTWRRDSIPLTFRLADEAIKPWLNKVWKDMRSAVQESLTLTGVVGPKFIQWQPWQLCYEVAQLTAGRTPILAFAEDHIAGYLNVWRSQDVTPVLYIEHLCLSPGSLPTKLWRERFAGLGMSLFAYAIHVSRENGLNGRVGLHAADANVLNSVYRRYAQRVPGLFKADATGIPGPTNYGFVKNLTLTYLETNETEAEQFLEGFRNA